MTHVEVPRELALELLDLWQQVSAKHVSLGTSCACGIGGVTLQLQDFEQDIVDFVLGQAERNKRSDVVAYVKSNSVESENGRGNVGFLLMRLSKEADAVPSDIPAFILEKLGKTLRSFARLHG